MKTGSGKGAREGKREGKGKEKKEKEGKRQEKNKRTRIPGRKLFGIAIRSTQVDLGRPRST